MKTTDRNVGKVSNPIPHVLNSADKKKQKIDMDKLLTAIVGLLTRHDPQELTYSRVSRLLKVPRPTLYYYFGNSPKTMIQEAVKFSMRAFVQLYKFDEAANYRDWSDFQERRLAEAVEFVRKFPWAPLLYFRYRTNLGDWGDSVQEVEMRYLEKLGESFEKFRQSKPDPRAVRLASYLKLGFLWGLAMEPEIWLSDENRAVTDKLVKNFTDVITEVLEQRF